MSFRELQPLWTSIERQCLYLLQHHHHHHHHHHHKHNTTTLLQIHAFILRNGLETNLNLLTKLITTLATYDPFTGIHHARRVFDQMPNKTDTFLCNTMLKSHLVARQFTESIRLYKLLLQNLGFKPDNYTFSTLSKSCASNVAFWEGLEVHNHVMKYGFSSNLYVATSLVDMYGKFGEMESARKVFDEMTERSSVSWTALIGGYVKCGDFDVAKELFDSMPEKDSAAFNLMVDAYVKKGDMVVAKHLFDEMPERNVVSWTSMIDGYCSNGNVDEARLLFDEMPEKNLFSWNAIIGGYCQNNQPHEALRLFHELQTRTMLEPDDVTIVSVLPAIADLGALELGKWVHQYVKRRKLDRSSNVCTALVDMYAKCGEIAKARKFFEEIRVKETSIWNALINGLAVNGCANEALEVFLEMRRKGFEPNEITMLGVLSACNHGGLVEEGKRWFKAMEEFGLTPKIEHYGCLVDLLGRAGCLVEAERLVESMPYEANGIILSSFLFACGYAKDVFRAERVINKAISMEPWNDGNYIMLRNLYATEKRWRDVEEIKGLMRRKGAKKEVGCSVIEINSKVWEFVAGDKVHPQWEGQMRMSGSLPETLVRGIICLTQIFAPDVGSVSVSFRLGHGHHLGRSMHSVSYGRTRLPSPLPLLVLRSSKLGNRTCFWRWTIICRQVWLNESRSNSIPLPFFSCVRLFYRLNLDFNKNMHLFLHSVIVNQSIIFSMASTTKMRLICAFNYIWKMDYLSTA